MMDLIGDSQMLPKISIITPCFNRADFAAQAIESVLSQDYPNFEHIIIDGGSTDGTLQVLSRYSHLNVISEPDQGMYDALNKGLALATGDFIGFLNTDDVYPPGVFAAVARAGADPALDAVVGSAAVYRQTDSAPQRLASYQIPDPSLEDFAHVAVFGMPIFNAWFFRRDVFTKIGSFDSRYKLVGDRDFMIRFAMANFRYKVIPQDFCHYYQHPGSLTFGATPRQSERVLAEHLIMLEKLLKNPCPEPARAYMKTAHDIFSLRSAAQGLKKGRLGQAAQSLYHGIRLNPALPWLAFGKIFQSRHPKLKN
jgi:glycosyltransferase involved in cell wall biosynthesis